MEKLSVSYSTTSRVLLNKTINRLTKISFHKHFKVSSCSNTGSIRDDSYWTSRKNILELIELIIQYNLS